MSDPHEVHGKTIGIGTDIIECHRIAQMIDKHEEQFLQRVFTRREVDYCNARKASTQHFAGRWAAKEAVLKVWEPAGRGIKWTDVEVCSGIDGRPTIQLAGQAKRIANELGIREILISISHCRTYAIAFATGIS